MYLFEQVPELCPVHDGGFVGPLVGVDDVTDFLLQVKEALGYLLL